jgi:hypothetical protein
MRMPGNWHQVRWPIGREEGIFLPGNNCRSFSRSVWSGSILALQLNPFAAGAGDHDPVDAAVAIDQLDLGVGFVRRRVSQALSSQERGFLTDGGSAEERLKTGIGGGGPRRRLNRGKGGTVLEKAFHGLFLYVQTYCDALVRLGIGRQIGKWFRISIAGYSLNLPWLDRIELEQPASGVGAVG